MGSRVMHYCIASLLSDKLSIVNKTDFLLGGIAPDVHYYMNVSKDITHFVDRDIDGKGHVNYMRFFNKYRAFINQPFYLGYLCHLISDDLWSKDTYFQIVKDMAKEERKEKLQISYRDFWRLNGRIISAYSLALSNYSVPKDLKIGEINVDSLPDLYDWIHKDFSYEEHVAREQLELFNDDNSQIIDYIDNSVKRSIHFISEHALLS